MLAAYSAIHESVMFIQFLRFQTDLKT